MLHNIKMRNKSQSDDRQSFGKRGNSLNYISSKNMNDNAESTGLHYDISK